MYREVHVKQGVFQIFMPEQDLNGAEIRAGLIVLLCYKQSQAPSVTKRAGGELLDKMSGNLNS